MLPWLAVAADNLLSNSPTSFSSFALSASCRANFSSSCFTFFFSDSPEFWIFWLNSFTSPCRSITLLSASNRSLLSWSDFALAACNSRSNFCLISFRSFSACALLSSNWRPRLSLIFCNSSSNRFVAAPWSAPELAVDWIRCVRGRTRERESKEKERKKGKGERKKERKRER